MRRRTRFDLVINLKTAPVSACGPTCCFRRPESAEASRREASRGLTEVFAGAAVHVRFGAHYGLEADVRPGPKTAPPADLLPSDRDRQAQRDRSAWLADGLERQLPARPAPPRSRP